MIDIQRHPIYTDYGADIDGNIYSFKRGLNEKTQQKHNNYLHFSLYYEKKRIGIFTHKFIYECFNGPVKLSTIDKPTIDHIDGNKLNNRLDNLQILSSRDNTRKHHNRTLPVGVYLHYNKYRAMITINNKSKYIGLYSTIDAAAASYNNEYEKIKMI